AAEAGHHLVADEHDPVPVADLTDRLQVAVGRDDDPIRPGDRLEDHGGDGVRALVLEDLLQVRRAGAHGAGIGMARGAAVRGPIVQSFSACSLIAATILGCWWPIETLTSCDAKSRYRFPSKSQKWRPSAPATGMGCSAFCTDHEWRTYSFASATTCRPSSVLA